MIALAIAIGIGALALAYLLMFAQAVRLPTARPPGVECDRVEGHSSAPRDAVADARGACPQPDGSR